MSEGISSRREFVKSSAVTAASVAAAHSIAPSTYAAGSDILKVGLIGCGGRGTGAAANALKAESNVRLVAMGDLFADQIDKSLKNLKNSPVASKVEVKDDHKFTGFDNYKGVTDACDVVVMATSPHFRPIHLEYAVEKGRHIFAEKPVATDAPMLRRCLETSEKAKEKNLSLVSGLCWRYHWPKVETMKRVLDGAIGDIVTIETVYNTGGLWHRGRQSDWSDMEFQIRNWLYFTWLSGDHITEQAIHSIDKMGWAMHEEPPKMCWGVGGRQVRTGKQYGDVFDHFSLVYEYANGVRGYHQCRQIPGAQGRVRDYIYGTKGVADVFGHAIMDRKGKRVWKYDGPANNMYDTEHVELFKSIRAGKPINNGLYMCRSTMLSIMGRMAAYTGQNVTWEKALDSKQELSPEKYDWIDLPEPEVATPGVTKLV